MARKYDFTRFVTTTTAVVSTVNDELEKVTEYMVLDGICTEDDAKKEAKKRYGVAKVEFIYHDSKMYGLTTEQVKVYGTELNPFTRQPWTTESEDEKQEVSEKYLNEQLNKKEQG